MARGYQAALKPPEYDHNQQILAEKKAWKYQSNKADYRWWQGRDFQSIQPTYPRPNESQSQHVPEH